MNDIQFKLGKLIYVIYFYIINNVDFYFIFLENFLLYFCYLSYVFGFMLLVNILLWGEKKG